MSGARSLRARLLGGVLLAVALVWIGVALSGWLQARHEAEELFDAHLAQSAAVLVALLSAEGDEDEEDEAEIELEHAPELHRYARNVAFQVWEEGRALQIHSRNAPQERLSSVEEGFADARIDGVSWRVFSTWILDRRALVQVGERIEARDAVGAEVATQLLLPLVVALPLLGTALWLAIGRALMPLRALADAVAARDARHLEAVPGERVPIEVQPLVERLNDLFRHIAASLERERAFTADAAHELRTPLAAIRAQAQVARAAQDADVRVRALDHVILGCDRAARLAEQLLTLARLESDEARARFSACDLAAIARDVLSELAQAAHSRGVELDLAAPGVVLLPGDAALLGVLIRNLVDNALRYGAAGGRVRVGIAVNGSRTTLCVVDQGPGLPADERARAFDRFHRGAHGGEPGAGLGLAIAARIAALHGARISLEDGPEGRGLAACIEFSSASSPVPERGFALRAQS